jgi:hypothetical protein
MVLAIPYYKAIIRPTQGDDFELTALKTGFQYLLCHRKLSDDR